MAADDILNDTKRDGITLAITEDGRIRYSGPAYCVRYWLPQIQKHQSEIAAALRGEFTNTGEQQ